jgi:hypothetical protein
MITVADIQKDFPDWPAGVIDPWLIELANDPGMGWPPAAPYGDHRWGRLLGQRSFHGGRTLPGPWSRRTAVSPASPRRRERT